MNKEYYIIKISFIFLSLLIIVLCTNNYSVIAKSIFCSKEDWTECASNDIKNKWIEYAPDWKFLKKKDDVLLYTRKLPSGIVQAKAEKIMYVKPEVVEQLVRDVPAYKEFMYKCFIAETIKIFNDEDMIVHNATAMPWPLKPRDGVVRTKVTKDWEYGRFEVLCYGLHPHQSKQFVAPVKGFVRMHEVSVYMIAHILHREKVKCFYIIHADPTGVPLFAVNLLIDSYPYYTIIKFEEMLKKPEYIDMGKKSKYLAQIEAFCKRKQNYVKSN